MRHIRIWTAMFCTLLLTAACADAPTEPPAAGRTALTAGLGGASLDHIMDPLIVIGDPSECDPYTSLDWCEGGGGGTCTTSDPGDGGLPSPDLDDMVSTSGCPGPGGGPGGGGGGGTTSPSDPADDPFADGPILFGSCFVAMLGVLAGTAAMLPTTDGIYSAAREVDSTERMLRAIVENDGDPDAQALWEFRVETARNRYNDAVGSFAIAAGFTALAVGGAAVACLPAALLPTP